MTYPEYEAKIREMVANPDSIATASVDLLAEIKKDTDTLESVHAQNAAYEKRVRDLQESNYQMYLRMTDGQPGGSKPAAAPVDNKSEIEALLGGVFGNSNNGEEDN